MRHSRGRLLSFALAAAVALLVPSLRGDCWGAFLYIKSKLPQRRHRGGDIGQPEAKQWRQENGGGSGVARKVLSSSRINWIRLSPGPEVEAQEGSSVLPVIPMTAVAWPGDTVQLRVGVPAYSRMYQDLLMRGQRRLLATFTKVGPGMAVDEVAEEDRLLHEVGCVVYLDDLSEVSEKSGGSVKYEASHSVLGRARVKRLLNPSALYEMDQKGNHVDYLRAEVEFIDRESEAPGTISAPVADDLRNVWQEIRRLSETMDEPRLRSEQYVEDLVANATTWQLADTWQQLQRQLQVHRQRAYVHAQLKAWVTSQQDQGLLPPGPPSQIDASTMPRDLYTQLQDVKNPDKIDLGNQFWEPLLSVLASENPEARTKLLSDLAREELSLVRARSSLRGVFQ